MSLTYRIVWADDSPEWVESVIGEIREHLVALGFDSDIQHQEDGEGLEERCKEDDLDLIIIDYNLPKENGDLIISKIREGGSFTQIVFYSQDQPPRNLIGPLDGLFMCRREEAVDRIKRVIDLTLHKLTDLGVIRGLVIANAIDLEVQMEELIIQVFGEHGELFKKRVIEKTFLDFGKKCDFLQGVLKDQIRGSNNESRRNELQEVKRVLSQFHDDVVDRRNILAHARSTKNDNGEVVLRGVNGRTQQIDVNHDWLRKVRADLRKHRENLVALSKIWESEALQ